MVSMRLFLTTSLVVPFAMLAACAAADSNEDVEEPEIKAGRVALENEDCGNDVTIRKKCKRGLVCARKLGAPISEHTAGICKKAPTGACAGQSLPACVDRACDRPSDAPGAACAADDRCSNAIGDACECVDGKFQCSVHAPLGPGCNLVCLP